MQVRILPAPLIRIEKRPVMGERNAAPSGKGSGTAKQAKGVATGNEKLQDIGQRQKDGSGDGVTVEREDGTFIGGKDRHGQPAKGGGSPEGHVVETGMPKDIVEEDKVKASKGNR